mgnify:CR=1 FL=1
MIGYLAAPFRYVVFRGYPINNSYIWGMEKRILIAIKNNDFKTLLNIFPEGIEYKGFTYTNPDSFELEGDYQYDSRWILPIQNILKNKALQYLIEKI